MNQNARKWLGLAAVSLAALAAAPVMAQSNLLVNGNFDTDAPGLGLTSLTGWNVLYGTIDLVSDPVIVVAQAGRNCLELTGTPGAAAVTQTVPTVAGRTYRLSGYVAYHTALDFATADLYLNGSLVQTLTAQTQGWTPWEHTFVATGNSTEIRFVDTTNEWDFGGAAIDSLMLIDVAAGNTYTVTNMSDSGAGSLRQAILDANAHTGHDTIAFNIFFPASFPSIAPTSPLPEIRDAVTIDGSTQPGNNSAPEIELNGANAGNSHGIVLRGVGASGSVIRGLIVNRFNQSGVVVLDGANNTLIEECYVGTDATGTSARPNREHGILAAFATATVQNCVASGNRRTGILVLASPGSVIQNNFTGTNKTGLLPIGNLEHGIEVEPASTGTRIENNVSSANGGGGITGGSSNGYIANNFVGTDSTGLNPMGNAGDGITAGTDSVTEYNLVSANTGKAISVQGVSRAVVRYNTIGTDLSGTLPMGNGTGINLDYGPIFDNEIYGNLVANSNNVGIFVAAASRTQVYDNVIRDNQSAGIFLWDSSPQTRVTGNIVERNTGGIGVAGDNNLVEGNIVGNNRERGIFVVGITGTGLLGNSNRISANSIFGNSGLGIDLSSPEYAVNPNDAGDVDEGANRGQNYPVLTGVTGTGNLTTVRGTLNSRPNTTYRVEFFSNATVSASGHSEGETYLGYTDVTTNNRGSASFTAQFPVALGSRVVTTTATDPDGNTSEFSRPFLTPRLVVNVTGIVRNGNTFAATLAVRNVGNGAATNARLTAGTLSASSATGSSTVALSATNTPRTLGTILAGESASVTLNFPSASAVRAGAVALLRTTTTWQGGSANTTSRVTLP